MSLLGHSDFLGSCAHFDLGQLRLRDRQRGFGLRDGQSGIGIVQPREDIARLYLIAGLSTSDR